MRPAAVRRPVSVALAVQIEGERVVAGETVGHRAEGVVAAERPQVVGEHVALVEPARDERLQHGRRHRRERAQPAPDEPLGRRTEQRRGRSVHCDEAQITVEGQKRIVPPVSEALPEVHLSLSFGCRYGVPEETERAISPKFAYTDK